MMGFLQDLRFAGRMLIKSPWVSAMAISALGLGIGVTATMFSIVYSALLRGLPFEGGDRIMAVSRTNPERGITRQPAPMSDFADWEEQQNSFEELAGYYSGTINVKWSDRPERFDGAFISNNTFRVVGVRPLLGRDFRPEDDVPDAPLTVMLSYHLWQDRFQGDPKALGQVFKVNGETAEVIGVMPEGFLFPDSQDLWIPLRQDALATPRGQGQYLTVVGKLRRDLSVDQASAEF
ncbi:MAG TPA: ABC transporter permease, partial [Longimicrobiales bacterium]|nr:ABC transporter permease [Longimicrobiales bacterium]